MSTEEFSTQDILDAIDLLKIEEVTTYSDLAEAIGCRGKYQELAEHLVKTYEIPPCDGARVVYKKRDESGENQVMPNTKFTSRHGVATRAEALQAAGVKYSLTDDGTVLVPSFRVVDAVELRIRAEKRQKRFTARAAGS
ncbi:hypothetical protein ACTQ49_14885 [Luteococcus sp. Sow4_B9]|uniref:hypothetical protein n=1 Tax=Luteococcus sp. Sow4_B9 TaxID=3438792 RepID=UPI003F9B88A2